MVACSAAVERVEAAWAVGGTVAAVGAVVVVVNKVGVRAVVVEAARAI